MPANDPLRRRTFLRTAAGLGGGLLWWPGCATADPAAVDNDFRRLAASLLEDWCSGMLGVQIDAPERPDIHGALGCRACGTIHGRCMDAVYPFLAVADRTGNDTYLEAGVRVFEWSQNVSKPDGSWTVMPDPKTWAGITVFGAIALGEAIHHHGHLLPPLTRSRWTDRLGRAADYVYRTFDLTFTNINYGFTAIHALHLLGEVLDRPRYTARANELGRGIPDWFTAPHRLLFGEGKPSDARSPRGLPAVDLGYNVEESLNGVVAYALREQNEELLGLLTTALRGHLEFMLPDGGWDNSWGTRQYKWSYWGSRTTDGCQLAYGLMSHREPAFGLAAYRNTQLLRRCTAGGLLHGGPDFVSHGVPPCTHHTFTHAKPLAALLAAGNVPEVDTAGALPREGADGLHYFPELNVWLAARGKWRGTVSAYDFVYRDDARQATGGSLALLYHLDLGPIFAASMVRYVEVERFNQQEQPGGEDFCLTPRVEVTDETGWYTNLYDLAARVKAVDRGGIIDVTADVDLVAADGEAGRGRGCRLGYRLETERVVIAVDAGTATPPRLVLPVRSPNHERYELTENRLIVHKAGGALVLETNGTLRLRASRRERVFNQVPGMEALPLEVIATPGGTRPLTVTLSYRA